MEIIRVVGAAIMDGGKILAAKRSPTMNSPLKWEFVGGKIEKDETHQQALRREVFEELGVDIKVKEHIATGYSMAGNKKIILDVYESEILHGAPAAREHSEIRWIELGDINNLDWAEADIPACTELLRRYQCIK